MSQHEVISYHLVMSYDVVMSQHVVMSQYVVISYHVESNEIHTYEYNISQASISHQLNVNAA